MTEQNYIVQYLNEIKTKKYKQIEFSQDYNNLPFSSLLSAIQIDGLIVHSSVKQLVDLYYFIYSETNTLPELCELQLCLINKAADLHKLKSVYTSNQSVIQNNTQAIQIIKNKIKQTQNLIQKQQTNTANEKLLIQQFKNQGLKLVLSQNRRMQFQLEKGDHELNIEDLTEEELSLEISKVKSNIKHLQQIHTRSYAFPMTKSDAVILLNQLDLQYQKQLLK